MRVILISVNLLQREKALPMLVVLLVVRHPPLMIVTIPTTAMPVPVRSAAATAALTTRIPAQVLPAVVVIPTAALLLPQYSIRVAAIILPTLAIRSPITKVLPQAQLLHLKLKAMTQ